MREGHKRVKERGRQGRGCWERERQARMKISGRSVEWRGKGGTCLVGGTTERGELGGAESKWKPFLEGQLEKVS